MAKTVTSHLEDDAYNEPREVAAAEQRPQAKSIATAALARVREAQFVDDGEMSEIMGNDALVRRLKDGSQHGPESSPAKHGLAQIDRGGVDGVDGVV